MPAQFIAVAASQDAMTKMKPSAMNLKKTVSPNQSSTDDDAAQKTAWNLERAIVSIHRYNDLVHTEKDTNFKFQTPLPRDQVIVRFLSKSTKNLYRQPVPNDMTFTEWNQLFAKLDYMWTQIKCQKIFEIPLIAGKSQHASTSHVMDSNGEIRQYLTLNRHYLATDSMSWKYGSANCNLSVKDFKTLRKISCDIDYAVKFLDSTLKMEYDVKVCTARLDSMRNDINSPDDLNDSDDDDDYAYDGDDGINSSTITHAAEGDDAASAETDDMLDDDDEDDDEMVIAAAAAHDNDSAADDDDDGIYLTPQDDTEGDNDDDEELAVEGEVVVVDDDDDDASSIPPPTPKPGKVNDSNANNVGGAVGGVDLVDTLLKSKRKATPPQSLAKRRSASTMKSTPKLKINRVLPYKPKNAK